MNRPIFLLVLCLALAGGATPTTDAAEESAPPGMSRQLLLKHELPPLEPKSEARVIRVQFPSGFKTPPHTHEGPGPRYVLKGKLRVEDNGQTHVYGPGDVFWETGAAMTVESIGGNDAEMVIFEVVPVPQPSTGAS
jgi:quercetin dioxygenase-like cupin family protein